MEVDPLVEAFTRSHDRVEQPRSATPPSDEIERDRHDGKPKRDEVLGPVEKQLELENREVADGHASRSHCKRLVGHSKKFVRLISNLRWKP